MKYIHIVCIMIAIQILAFSIDSQCYGEQVNIDFYQSAISSKNQTEVLLMKNYVKGVLDGIQWSNVLLITDNKTPLYCSPPENLGINTANAIQIIDNEIQSMRYKNDRPISILLLFGLQKTFPCKK